MWLATGAAVLVLAAFTTRALAPLWFVAFPLLASVFPDGRFVPRWTVVPVVLCVVPVTVELVSPGVWSDQPWWTYFAASQLLFLGAQVHRYRRRATTEERESVRWIILGTLLTMACFAAVAAAFGGDIGEGSDWSNASANLAILPITLGIAAGVVRPRGLDVDRALHITVTGWVAVPVLAARTPGRAPCSVAGGARPRLPPPPGRWACWAGGPPTGWSTAVGPMRRMRPAGCSPGSASVRRPSPFRRSCSTP